MLLILPIRNIRWYRLVVAILFCVALLAQGNIAHAYYYGWGSGLGWGYYSMGTSLLWPLSSMLYPYSGYANPYNLNSSIFGLGYMGAGAATQSMATPYKYLPNNNLYNNVANSNNFYNNASGAWQMPALNFSGNNYNNSQSPVPIWNQQPANKQSSNDPNDVFSIGEPRTTNSPPTAPDRRLPLSNEYSANQLAASPTQQYMASVNGFLQAVNLRYKGDLLHALYQPDMRAWAQSLGLVDPRQILPANLPKARKSQLSSILKDNSLDAQTKLELIRLLLR